MLASPAADVEDALAQLGPAAVEWKLDGARVQVHRDGDDVRVYTRSLDDVTARVPEVVEAALALPARAAVLDGEAIALRADGRPQPFQVTGSRAASAPATSARLFFDVLHVDGEDLLDRPAPRARRCSPRSCPEALRVPRVLSDDAAGASAFLDAALRGATRA